MKKFSLSLMALAVWVTAGAQTFSGGDGSEATPYLIKTVNDMNELSTAVLGGNNFSGKYVRLDNDITYGTGDAAAVVGDKGKKFGGTFDGNNHSISGFKVSGAENQAMFAYVSSGATIKNLKVKNAIITSSGSYTGVIVGQSEGAIENCQVEDATLNSTGGSFIGGIAGQSKGIIRSCAFSGSITTTTSSAGCIVGQNWDGNIYSCQSSGTIVSQKPSGTTSPSHLGGIAGVSLGLSSGKEYVISDCYFTGTITGSYANYCGGIVGNNTRTEINNCFSAAYISSAGSVSYTGGIVGYIDSGSIKNCYNAGTLYNEDCVGVGGIVGYLGNKETVEIENVVVYGTIFGNKLFLHEGCEFVGTQTGKLSIKNCYFDSQVCGNYSKDGAKTTKELTDGTSLEGFDASVWTFANGLYPRLKKFEDLEAAKLYAVPVYYADGDVQSKVTKSFTLGNAIADVEWQLSGSDLVSVNGNNVTVTRGTKQESVVITSYLGGSQKRSLAKIYPTIFSGEGTEANPYVISSREDMDKLADATNTQGITFEKEYFKVTNDIDMGGSNFTPIASGAAAFAGTLDGSGYTLKNFAMDNLTDSKLNYGLFCVVSKDGTVKNLNMAATNGLKVYRNFAPFVCNLYGTIDNCVNYASFDAAKGYAGGVVCFVEETGKVVNCLNAGNITASETGAVGGICVTNYGTVENSVNVGTIKVADKGGDALAGVVAKNSGKISNVLNAGMVVSATGVKGAGGIAGSTNATSSISSVVSVAPIIANGNYNSLSAIVGAPVAGAAIKEAYYDGQIVLYSGADATEKSTSQLIDENSSLFADGSVWTRTAGMYPVLKNFADNEIVKFYITPVVITDGNRRDQLVAGFDLPAGATWSTKTASVFKVENGKLVVSESDEYAEDELVGTKNDMSRVIPVATFGKFLAGSGSEIDPYQISSSSDLVKLSTVIEKSNNSFEGKTFKMLNDIDMSGVSISPIANGAGAGFGGKFDGAGKTIKNLSIKQITDSYAGLFGRLSPSAEVINLTLDKKSGINGTGYVGAFAGMSAGKIKDCKNYATVSASASFLGGFVGMAEGGAQFVNCENYGVVKSTKDYVGGIVGKAGSNSKTVTISECINEGNISGTTRIGGIAGHVEVAEVTYAVNKGGVTGSGANVGGVVGYANGQVNCVSIVNEGEVSGASDTGGLVGYATKSSNKILNLSSSYNVGEVKASKTNLGGLVGRAEASIISQCFNMGDVTNSAATVSTSAAGAGGLVGSGVPTISQSYNVGTVTANSSVGGILAYPSSTYTAFKITDVYSAGKVVATKSGATNVGTIIGKAPSKNTSYTNVYYDKTVNPTIKAIAGSDGTVKTVSAKELADVDFSDAKVWKKSAYHYPRLTTFADAPASYLSSAAVVLADGDTYASVSKAFNVGGENVTWTGDDVFTIVGDKVDFNAPSVGEYSLTASAGDLKRVIKLTLAATSGIGNVSVDGNVAEVTSDGVLFNADSDYAIYSVNGAVIVSGRANAGETVALDKGIYLVKVSGKVIKALVK